jgi:hypothetical protein
VGRRFLASLPNVSSTPLKTQEEQASHTTPANAPGKKEIPKAEMLHGQELEETTSASSGKRDKRFLDMNAEEVLQALRNPKKLSTFLYVVALQRLERLITERHADKKCLTDATFRQLLDTLAAVSLNAVSVGLITHVLRNLKIRHAALEQQLQTRALVVHEQLPPDAIQSYLSWLCTIHFPDIATFNVVLAQVVRRREELKLKEIVSIMKAAAKVGAPSTAPAIQVLCQEFGKHQPELRVTSDLGFGRMGEFCFACAKLGVFSPDLAKAIELEDYCVWARKTMREMDLIGILGAYGEAAAPIPDPILTTLLARISELLPSVKPTMVCDILFQLGRGSFEGAPLNPLITAPFVNSLVAPVMKNADLPAKSIGLAVYGLAGLPQPHGLEGALRILAKRVQASFQKNPDAEFRGPSDILLVLEGFAGLSDVYSPSKNFITGLFKLMKRLKHKFDSERATRAIRAMSVLPHCDSQALANFFQDLFPDVSKFPSNEAFVDFQEAIAQLPIQEVTLSQPVET